MRIVCTDKAMGRRGLAADLPSALPFEIDVTNEEQTAAMADAAVQAWGGIDVVCVYFVYNAPKGAVITLVRGLAAELAPAIRVNAVAPVSAATRFDKNARGADRPENLERTLVKGIPTGRRATLAGRGQRRPLLSLGRRLVPNRRLSRRRRRAQHPVSVPVLLPATARHRPTP
jgi:NAD(P)-dependent dehydrogenase (short-subunit alcohol dehydrogenase family)